MKKKAKHATTLYHEFRAGDRVRTANGDKATVSAMVVAPAYIVVLDGEKDEYPYCYQEHELRPLTARERGPAK
jgi:hypothetical protein